MVKKSVIWGSLFFLLALSAASGNQIPNGRRVTDQAGRQVMIPDKVHKIVTTFKPATLCVLSLGLAPRLVGVDTSSKRDRLSQAVFPGITQVAGVGNKSMGINFETLVSLEPDLVILSSIFDP